MDNLFILIYVFQFCMGKNFCSAVKEDFSLYSIMIGDVKSIYENPINVSTEKANNSSYLVNDGEVQVKHLKIEKDMAFLVEVRKNNHKYFHFKLMCNNFAPNPFFRYDSDGETHRNYDSHVPLGGQQIITPHFHKFDLNGIEIAYRTEILEKTEADDLAKDISLSMKIFCNESQTFLGEDATPIITILPNSLPIPIWRDDPNLGVKFP